MEAKRIINREIEKFNIMNHKKDKWADRDVHHILGMLAMAVELHKLSLDEMDQYIDMILKKYHELEPI